MLPKICAYSASAARDVLTVPQMRAAEQSVMAAGTSGLLLMERAGRAVAAEIERRSAGARPGRAVVLCGPGNNGGDGYVVARVLKDRGWSVDLFALAPRAALGGDARRAAGLWDGLVHPAAAFDGGREADVIVDALFGTGLSRDLDAPAVRLLSESARACAPRRAGKGEVSTLRVAVDIASGVNGDTGAICGAAFEADVTVTFHALKPGHLLVPGRYRAGDLVVADIGLGPGASVAALRAADGPQIQVNAADDLVARIGGDPAGHKYDRGHALVVAGGIEGVGAPRLAARAALRVGAGLVTIAAPAAALLAHAARGPDALMLRRSDGPDGLAALLEDKRRNALVLGPALGVGSATRELAATALASGCAVALDADAITSFAGDWQSLATLTAANGRAVLTPHEGEYARLFAEPPEKKAKRGRRGTQAPPEAAADLSRLQRALLAAARLTAVVVLKGPDTVIAAPDGRAAISVTAPPWLATAGSGDVLAGLIAGLMAQGFSPYDSACCGVFLHGEAGRLAGRGLIADDLPEAVARVLGGD